MPSNNLGSNVTRKLLRKFIPAIEKQRVLSKAVNTQLFQGKFTPASGATVDVKRSHRYVSKRTADGDISGGTPNAIIAGKATATVQNYITVDIDWDNIEEALQLDQLEEILMPAAEECVTELETSFNEYMIANAGLSYGTPGTAVDAWADVAGPQALMSSLGIPGEKYYALNPFTVKTLAGVQTGLSADPSRLVQTAWEKAQISQPFGGLQCLASNSLATRTSGNSTDRIGALKATPTATYASVKDTMVQTLSYDGLTASQTPALAVGDILEFTGTGALARSYIHQKTRQTILNGTSPVKWRCVVVEASNSDVSGEGTVVVAGPAIKETSTQYDTISSALVDTDIFTVIGAVGVEYQPNMFFSKDAFTIAFVKLPKLYSTDTIAKTSDGLSIRCSKYSDGDKNVQKIRFDLLPAFGTLNPFYAGQGFGV